MLSQNEISRILNAFQHPLVRDLAWAIGSADLLQTPSSLGITTYQEYHHELLDAWLPLKQLDQNPSPLIAKLIHTKDVRLGSYFENLIFYWWSEIKNYHPMWTGLQINDHKRTIGAFDALLYNTDQSIHSWQHWELTLKFYLSYQGNKNWQDWIGPGGRDRLSLKLQRMQTHQFMLDQHPASQRVLTDNHIDYQASSQTQRAMIKGVMFDAYQRRKKGFKISVIQDGVESHGLWMHATDLAEYTEYIMKELQGIDGCVQFGWRRCIKPHWLAPLYDPFTVSHCMWDLHLGFQRRIDYQKGLPLMNADELIHSYPQYTHFGGAIMYSLQSQHTEDKLTIPAPFDKLMQSSHISTKDSFTRYPRKIWQEIHRIFVTDPQWPHLNK
jgi:hypothetical protein